MATYVESQPAQPSGNGMGYLLGVIILIIAAVLFFIYGLPFISGSYSGGSAHVNLPSRVNVQTK